MVPNDRPWKIALASATGLGHRREGTGCQDRGAAGLLDSPDGEVLVLVACDGLGSASHSDLAAQITCDNMLAGLTAHLERSPADPPIADQVNGWMELAIGDMAQHALRLAVPASEFACTLLLAVVAQHWSAYAQVGDGAIVLAGSGDAADWSWVFWPEGGEEYINETACLRPGFPLPALQMKTGENLADEIAVFTDGLQGMALHYASQTVHAPFFAPLFDPLRAWEGRGVSEALTRSLASLLADGAFDRRSEDDRTLLLATRCPPAPAA